MDIICTLRENSLHAALKDWYMQSGDQVEVVVDGYVIDLVRENLLIEIQTVNFYAIKKKLTKLLNKYPVRLVYPISHEKWIVRQKEDGTTSLGRRKSPKHCQFVDVFYELVRFPQLVQHPNFSLEILLIREEVVWRDDGHGSWKRRGNSIVDRKLLEVLSSRVFTSSDDFRIFIPATLPPIFTTAELSKSSETPKVLARKMAYCLREMGVFELVGKRGRSFAYQVQQE